MAEALVSVAVEKLAELLGQRLSLFAEAAHVLEIAGPTHELEIAELLGQRPSPFAEAAHELEIAGPTHELEIAGAANELEIAGPPHELEIGLEIAGPTHEPEIAGATHELKKLFSTLQSIRAVLADAEGRQVRMISVHLWLSRLRHVAYDIDDLVEEQISGLRDEEGNEDDGNSRNKECECFPLPYNCSDYAVSRYKIVRNIKEIRERLEQIDFERNRFAFSNSAQGGDDRMLEGSHRQTTSLMDESEMFIGRENDKETIMGKLVSGSSHEDWGRVQVVAVVGIGGLGKTTLARKIYHDDRVQDHFNSALLWVCVSDIFDVMKLTKAILEQVKKASTSLLEFDELRKELLEALGGKRFLLVLDDVWNDDAQKWNVLQLALNNGAQGSRILVTTRSEIVANTLNATYIHRLQGLSDDQSWTLFSSKAFAGWKASDFSESESMRKETVNRCIRLLLWIKVIRNAMHSRKKAGDYSAFESIGKEIVNKCKGVPLSIVVIANAMRSQGTVEDWKNILDGEIWSLPQVTNEILPTLLPTYCHLPAYLKQCFVYCSMFPKDWLFEKDILVRLWVALGFIRSEGNRDIKDIGAKYFNLLVKWSMFQQVKEDGKAIYYTMHDLHHDLAKFIARDEIYTFINRSEGVKSNKGPSSNVRHAFLSFTDNDDKPSNIPIIAGRVKKLRTLWVHGIDRSGRVIVDILRQTKFLRALSFMGSKYSEKIVKLLVKLLDAIGKMRQLRYLDLSRSDIVELPESVSHLRNLHTLDLTGCVKLKRLPRGMGGMVSLRYLEIERTDSLECLPEGLGKISGLQSLCKFIVGDEGGCGIDELQQLNSLQGTLRIQHLERVSGREEAEKAQLLNKQYISRLVLSMSGSADADSEKMDGVIEGLRPHENLEELKLFWYTGSNLPSWLEVIRLHKLELCGCPNLKGFLHHHLTSASPRELIIRNCDRIEGISISSSSFVFLEKISVIDSSEFFSSGLPHLPKLKTFEICRIRNETLPDRGWEEWTSLETLEIWNCNELKSLPDGLMHLKSLQHLEISSCKKLESLPNGLEQLPRLGPLLINGCPLLSERCRKGKEVLIGPRFHPSPISKSTSK